MITLRLSLVFSLFLLQQDGPPPEPPEDRPACNNFHSTPTEHQCACGKAMKCDGKIDDAPDPAIKGMKWCTQFCKKSKCKCVGPCETLKKSNNRRV